MSEQILVAKKRVPILFVIISAVSLILIAVIVLLIVFFVEGSSEKKYAKKLQIADKYLNSLDYENAILTYKEAISIEQNKSEAHLDLAYVYYLYAEDCFEKDEYEEAEFLAKLGKEELDEIRDKELTVEEENKLKRIEKQLDKLESKIEKDFSKEQKTEKGEISEEPSEIVPSENSINRELFKEYFYQHYSNDDLVCFADVTDDGLDEMIVVWQSGIEEPIGYVYMIQNGTVNQIYERTMYIDWHEDRTFNWYLVTYNNHLCLGEDSCVIYQGLGYAGVSVYHFSNQGEIIYDTTVQCAVSTRNVGDPDYDPNYVSEEETKIYEEFMSKTEQIIGIWGTPIETSPLKVFEQDV